MINFNEERCSAVVYTCGTCNLNCRYCLIDKNPALVEIDKQLEESFKGDYYFNRIKAYFPRRDQLQRLETWGGEPFLHMDRIYPLIHQLIDYYPYFSYMFSSTNFSYEGWIDQFMGLMNCFAQYPYRHFEYNLQLSVDGPPYINDANRGKGVTERCLKNFDKLVQQFKEDKFPKNVFLTISLKGTWDIDCIKKLNSKEKLIEFFRFYEDAYVDKIAELNMPDRVYCNLNIPNLALPSPATKENGIEFAQLVQKCREIEEENRVNPVFKYYQVITPLADMPCLTSVGYRCNGGHTCGSGSTLIGFLPHDIVSACHEGFTLLAENYKKAAMERKDSNLTVNINKFIDKQPVPMCLTDDQYAAYEKEMSNYKIGSSARIATSVNMIIALAMAGEIEERYLNERDALAAATFMYANCAFCIKNNHTVSGSLTIEPVDSYKLLLNGALQYLTQGGLWYGESGNI